MVSSKKVAETSNRKRLDAWLSDLNTLIIRPIIRLWYPLLISMERFLAISSIRFEIGLPEINICSNASYNVIISMRILIIQNYV